MTDFDMGRWTGRPEPRSERAFWLYVALSVCAHFALMTWLLPGGFASPSSAPAILVRLINPPAAETLGNDGGGGEPAGGSAPVAALAEPAPAAPAPVAHQAVPVVPTVSPIKEERVTPTEPEPEPAIQEPSAANLITDGDGDADGALQSGPGGPGDGSGDGSGNGPGPGGPGVGSGGDLNVRRRLPVSYQNDVVRRIRKNRDYPTVCRQQHTEGTARVWIKLDADGSVAEVKIATSSGSDELDRAAIAAVRKTTFAPFPNEFDQPFAVMKVPVDFRLND